MSDLFAEATRRTPVIGVFRGATVERALELSRTAWRAGVELVEVTVETDAGLDALRAVVAAAQGRTVGAGTVTTRARLDAALEAGAAFIVSPGLHPDVVDECVARDIAVLPGVATATEVAAAADRGIRWVKAFPASVLTPEWVAAMRGPFPEISFVASGGVGPRNAAAFLDAGCRAVASGSSFATPDAARTLLASVSSRRTRHPVAESAATHPEKDRT